MEPRFLILETSCRIGQVAVARGDRLLEGRRLEEARRHARDLIPAARDLFRNQGWKARDLDGIILGRGPGSYTGLRVGFMTAKTMAYALNCSVVGIDTFAAVARQAPPHALRLDVLADAQQGKIYVQKFARNQVGVPFATLTSLAIRSFSDWRADLEENVWLSGPGLEMHEKELQECRRVDSADREPHAQSLLVLGKRRFDAGEKDDFWSIEPLYLRPSAAEEKWSGG